MIKQRELFKIKNIYLKKAFFGDFSIKTEILNDCYGYLSANDQYNLGRSFIEYCYKRAFSIHRLPDCKVDWYSNRYRYEYHANYQNISEEILNDACNELINMYNFVQKYFEQENKQSMKLRRMLQSFETQEYFAQRNNEKLYVELPSNIFTSYSYDLIAGGYSSDVVLYRDVDKSKIVMIDYLLSHPEYPNKAYDDECEIWVLENNIHGITKVDKSCIKVFNYENKKFE